MKRNIIGGLAVSALLGVSSFGIASAADMPLKEPPISAPAVIYDWTGLYVGGNVGGIWTRGSGTRFFPPGDPFSIAQPDVGSINASGVIGGFQQGINWQFVRSWVIGIEGDFSFTDATGSFSKSWVGPMGTVPGSLTTMSTKLDWLASARERLGYLVTPNLMAYGTGGVAWGKIGYQGATSLNTVSTSFAASTAFTSVSEGWVAGGGLEWMFDKHWLVRGEYLYYHLSSGQTASATGPISITGVFCIPGPCPTSSTSSLAWSHMNVNVLRAALSYKF